MSSSPVIKGGSSGGATSGKNLVINASMDLWQRGTQFIAQQGRVFTADRWKLIVNDGDLLRSTDVPAGSEFLYSYSQSRPDVGGGSRSEIATYLELPAVGVAGVYQNGRTFTLQKWVKGAAGTTNQTLIWWANGSVTTPTTNIFTGALIEMTGSWQKVVETFVINSNPDIDANCIRLSFDSQVVTDPVATLFTGVQLEVGGSASDFEYKNITQIQNECYRYYWNSFSTPDTPHTRNLQTTMTAFTDVLAQCAPIFFPSPLRAAAVITFYDTENSLAEGTWSFYNGVAWEEAIAEGSNGPDDTSMQVRMTKIDVTPYGVFDAYIVAGNIALDAEF
jgi:hypothetical protein